ncbi:MAG: electron transfer flavoprotein subunit beta/FixA family protein [Actinobacteria bacterium]|nr:electron transfer flavoprotein subunit beta/FixA family protein [Actinomycetota bacterium]
MDIVVAMKQVPDLQQLRIRNREPVMADVPLTFGKIDKNALEAAVLLKEEHGGEVVVVAAGSEELEDTIKEAMAAGGDRSIMLADDKAGDLDSAESAEILAQLIKQVDDCGLIIFGEGSGDNYSGQVGSRVAEKLDLPQVGSVTQIIIDGEKLRLTRSLEDSVEIVEVMMPAVVIVTADLNEPRIPSVSQVLKAGRKPKEIISLDELEQPAAEKTLTTLSNLAPEVNRKRITIKSVEELVEILKTEGFVGGN